MFAKGTQLAQIRLGTATAATAFSATLHTEVTSIWICNTTSSAAKFGIFHDEDGTTFDQTTALHYQQTIAGNTTVRFEYNSQGAGVALIPSAALGIETDTASALTFSVYGITEDLAPLR